VSAKEIEILRGESTNFRRVSEFEHSVRETKASTATDRALNKALEVYQRDFIYIA
jgi:hypothetical protein